MKLAGYKGVTQLLFNTLEHPCRLFWWVAVDLKVGQEILVHFLPSLPWKEPCRGKLASANIGSHCLPLLRFSPHRRPLSCCMMVADGGQSSVAGGDNSGYGVGGGVFGVAACRLIALSFLIAKP